MNFQYNINGLRLFGYHGVYDAEKKDGQYFLVDIKFLKDYNSNNLDDDVNNVIDYSTICNDVAEIFTKRCNLIETLIDNIKNHLEKKYIGILFEIRVTKESYDIDYSVENIKIKNIL